MKTFFVLLAGFVVISAQAQSTNTQSEADQPLLSLTPVQVAPVSAPQPLIKPPEPEPVDPALRAQIDRPLPQVVLVLKEPKPNEVIGKRFTFSGIFVQFTKSDNLLQLFNPAAPADYGAAEDNLVIDPINGHPAGLKFFSIQF